MINIHKKNIELTKILKSREFSTDIKLYFSTRTVGDDFDPEEKNYTYTNLNPITIKGYVRDIKMEALVWKQYGLSEVGAKEVLVEDKYADWFRKCNKVVIDGDDFTVYKEATGNRLLITKLPLKIVKIVLQKTS